MSEKIVQLIGKVIKGQIKEPVRGGVEETLKGRPALTVKLGLRGICNSGRSIQFHKKSIEKRYEMCYIFHVWTGRRSDRRTV